MYINVYKTETKNNDNISKNQKFIEKAGNGENNMYNYTQNYCNIYHDEEDDDNILGEYGAKLVGKEMLKKNIRDKDEIDMSEHSIKAKFKHLFKYMIIILKYNSMKLF